MTQSRGSLLVLNASHCIYTSKDSEVCMDPTSSLQIVGLMHYKLMKLSAEYDALIIL